MFFFKTNRTQPPKLTLGFKLVQRGTCEFGPNPFGGSRDIKSQTVTHRQRQNRTLRSSLCMVMSE